MIAVLAGTDEADGETSSIDVKAMVESDDWTNFVVTELVTVHIGGVPSIAVTLGTSVWPGQVLGGTKGHSELLSSSSMFPLFESGSSKIFTFHYIV